MPRSGSDYLMCESHRTQTQPDRPRTSQGDLMILAAPTSVASVTILPQARIGGCLICCGSQQFGHSVGSSYSSHSDHYQ
eukprot:1280527-Amphidinium_carterae.1